MAKTQPNVSRLLPAAMYSPIAKFHNVGRPANLPVCQHHRMDTMNLAFVQVQLRPYCRAPFARTVVQGRFASLRVSMLRFLRPFSSSLVEYHRFVAVWSDSPQPLVPFVRVCWLGPAQMRSSQCPFSAVSHPFQCLDEPPCRHALPPIPLRFADRAIDFKCLNLTSGLGFGHLCLSFNPSQGQALLPQARQEMSR